MKILGHLDLCGPSLIEGWLYADTDLSFKLQVYIGELLIGECVADRFRADLQALGHGEGRCGFTFEVPETPEIDDFAATKLRIVDSPVYLLPDDHTFYAPKKVRASEVIKQVEPGLTGQSHYLMSGGSPPMSLSGFSQNSVTRRRGVPGS